MQKLIEDNDSFCGVKNDQQISIVCLKLISIPTEPKRVGANVYVFCLWASKRLDSNIGKRIPLGMDSNRSPASCAHSRGRQDVIWTERCKWNTGCTVPVGLSQIECSSKHSSLKYTCPTHTHTLDEVNFPWNKKDLFFVKVLATKKPLSRKKSRSPNVLVEHIAMIRFNWFGMIVLGLRVSIHPSTEGGSGWMVSID